MIIGENIYLRPVIRKDLILLNNWRNDEETFQFLGGGFMPISIDQQEKWLDSIIDNTGNNKRFIICESEHKPIGMIGLYSINWVNRTCELGVYIGDKNSQGRGYGKESCKMIERFATEYLNLRKIKLKVVSDNTKAINMWKSLGYEKIGKYKKERYVKGEYKNLILMEKFL